MINTFASEKNINEIENNLKAVEKEESLNSISLSGKYMKDPKPYYDASKFDKNNKKVTIVESLEKLRKELINTGPVLRQENFPFTNIIQNIQNSYEGETNDLTSDSNFIPVNLNSNI